MTERPEWDEYARLVADVLAEHPNVEFHQWWDECSDHVCRSWFDGAWFIGTRTSDQEYPSLTAEEAHDMLGPMNLTPARMAVIERLRQGDDSLS